jgi:riboflavin transporter FmnP
MTNAKSIALTISFAGIAIVLNPAVSGLGVPYPPFPSLIFNVWEIPVITVFLLFGFRFGMSVAALNALFLFAVWPGPSRPFYALGTVFSAFSMMLGIYVMYKAFGHRFSGETAGERAKIAVSSTIFAALLRIAILAPYMYFLLRSPVYSFPDVAILTFVLPWQAIYNIAQPLITIPIAFIIARGVYKSIGFNDKKGLSSLLV